MSPQFPRNSLDGLDMCSIYIFSKSPPQTHVLIPHPNSRRSIGAERWYTNDLDGHKRNGTRRQPPVGAGVMGVLELWSPSDLALVDECGQAI